MQLCQAELTPIQRALRAVPVSSTAPTPADELESQTQAIGQSLWKHLRRSSPSVLDRRWWDERILAWAMTDEAVKVQMFRFIDVLPMLRTPEAVTRHLREYFEEVADHFPGAARLALEVSSPGSVLGRAVAMAARRNATQMARRFIAGQQVDEVLQTLVGLRRKGLAFTLDLLGEAIISEAEADAYLQAYLDLLRGLGRPVARWPINRVLDHDHVGPIPRLNVSVKLSALYSQFNPPDPARTLAGVKGRLRPLLREARAQGAFVHVDMEHYALKEMTLSIFCDVLREKEFRDYADVGIVVQAYLPESGRDLERLRDWARERGTPVWIRLVKGAYWDFETVVAAARGWPVPVYTRKWQSDDNFERQSEFLMENWQWLRPAFGSHNLRSLSHAIAAARVHRVPDGAWEVQTLYGMGSEMAQLFAERGYRVRVYTPFGDLIPGMAYLVRRLLENTSNDSFLRASFAANVQIEDLLMKPADRGAQLPPEPEPGPDPVFVNEPLVDFAVPAERTRLQHALGEVADQFDRRHPLVIGGRRVDTRQPLVSLNPSNGAQIVGSCPRTTVEHARQAVAAARQAYRAWSQTPVEHRCEYLEVAARKMLDRRAELTAWIIVETGKPWTEADADVAEAVDFLRYYAQQMRELDQPLRCDVPGEENAYTYRPRGVAVVIAPWNFPLAILTGMTAAALVAGNTVVMKPAEQSFVIAAKLMEMFEEAGLPDGVLNYLPGVGEEIGPVLVEHPDVDLVAFTGSLAVGLGIHESAAKTAAGQQSIKRVIAELGGKNAIIVDDDANLDEAVQGVVQSAFGYAGQKCSACSRAIVVRGAYDEFCRRLKGAVESLVVGPAEDPGTFVGPVIDPEARARIQAAIAKGEQAGRLLAVGRIPEGLGLGYYVAPHVFADVAPNSPLAQEEIFGPVLAVLPAESFEQALELANGTRFALTGGVYSRSPVNLKLARQRFEVGNLYLNRSITGAMVQRHPFGGYKLSGIGSKAGGPDYLLQFLVPVNICENTLRRGFAPNKQAGERRT